MNDLLNLSIEELHTKLAAGELSCVELAKLALARAEEAQATLNAFITITGELALKQAAEADKMFAEGRATLLTGIPYALKDNFCVTGTRTTAGSKILENYIAPYTATAASRLETAGAVLIGKTNMDEFAMGSSTEYSAYGPTRNPYDAQRVPGGSSGGSAVAVATGACVFALGTETGGSVRLPASFCNLVGLKPTYGRISRYGVIALASSLDAVAPLARSVKDVSIVTGWLAGCDPKDSTTPDQPIPQYETHLTTTTSVKGMKIGLPKEYFEVEGLDAEVQQVVAGVIKQLEQAGAEMVPISLPLTKYALPAYYVLVPSEASSNLARYAGVTYGLRATGDESAQDIIEHTRDLGFGAEPKRRIMLGAFALSAGYQEAYYGRAQKVRTLIKQEFEAAFELCDVLLSPTSPTPAFELGAKSDPLAMYLMDVFTLPSNLAGNCSISIPAGFSQNKLPIGVQLIAPQFAEDRLFQTAYAVEQELNVGPGNVKPVYLNKGR